MAATNAKKRTAKTQPGPAQKKAKTFEKSKLAPSLKRSKPITAPADSAEEESDLDEEGEDDVDFEASPDDTEEMQIDSSKREGGNSARESHILQKAVQQSRKAAKPHSDLIAEAKRVWAQARSKEKGFTPEKRKEHVTELMKVVRGKVKEIVFKHDASRIIQTLVKYGSKAQREEICDELKGTYIDLARNRYAKFLLVKLIRLLPSHRPLILASFHGKILQSQRLLLHREASGVLADAFELYANSVERAGMVREFYGKEVSLFSSSQGDSETAKQGLAAVMKSLGGDKEKTRRILAAVKENLDSIFNNPDKGAVRHAIVHRAMWEYLDVLGEMQDSGNAEEAAEADKLRRELFDNSQELLPEIVHTKDGSRVAREFLARGNAKDRKVILKALKPHIERMCIDEEAQMVLLTAMDVIDDTKLLQKSLASVITQPATLNTLIQTPQGRRVILYLIVPRSKRHFTVAQIKALGETDAARDGGGVARGGDDASVGAGTSKKSPETRQAEVRKGASEALLKWIEEKGGELVMDETNPASSLVVGEIMLYAEGDKSQASQALLRILAKPYPPPSTASSHPIDLPHTSRLYKTLLQGGHFNHSLKSVEPCASWNPFAFAVQFVDTVGSDDGQTIKDVCIKGDRNGTFVVAELCGALVKASYDRKAEEGKEVRKKLKLWLTAPEMLKEIHEGETTGVRGVKVLVDAVGTL